MPCTSCEPPARRTPDKIAALCIGLAACNAVLLILRAVPARFLGAQHTPRFFIDDIVFGIPVAHLEWLLAAELALFLAVPLLQNSHPRAALTLGILTGTWLFAESLADAWTYRADWRLVAEETYFATCGGLLTALCAMVVRATLKLCNTCAKLQ